MTDRNLCSLDLTLLFIVFVGRKFVSGICKLKPPNNIKPTSLFLFKTLDMQTSHQLYRENTCN